MTGQDCGPHSSLSPIHTGLAVGLDPQGYGNPDFCWLSLQDSLIWSFAGPVGMVIIVSVMGVTQDTGAQVLQGGLAVVSSSSGWPGLAGRMYLRVTVSRIPGLLWNPVFRPPGSGAYFTPTGITHLGPRPLDLQHLQIWMQICRSIWVVKITLETAEEPTT